MAKTREVKLPPAKHRTKLQNATDWMFSDEPINRLYPMPSGKFLILTNNEISILDSIKKTKITLPPIKEDLQDLLVTEDVLIYTYWANFREFRIACRKLNSSEPLVSLFLQICVYSVPGQIMQIKENCIAIPIGKECIFLSINPFMKLYSIPLDQEFWLFRNHMLYMLNGQFLRSTRNEFRPANIMQDYCSSCIGNEKSIIELFEIRNGKEVVLARKESKKLDFTHFINHSPTSIISTFVEKDQSYIRVWKINNSTFEKDFKVPIKNFYFSKIILLPDNQTILGTGTSNPKEFITFNVMTKQIMRASLPVEIYDVGVEPNGLVGFATKIGLAVIPYEVLVSNNYLNNVRTHLQVFVKSESKETGVADVILSYLGSNPAALFSLNNVPIGLAQESISEERKDVILIKKSG